MGASKMVVGVLSMGACLLLGASLASALPIELKDGANTKYFINTAVDPLIDTSLASGAVTNATYTKTVTVTSTFIGFTPWWGFTTVYTVQFEITEPLTPAFVGFNGLTVVGVNNVQLPDPVIYNPGEGVTEECMQGNANRQLVFQPQSFPTHNLTLQRKVFVPHNDEFVRWLNIITTEARMVTTIIRAPTAARLEPRNSIMTVMDAPAPSNGTSMSRLRAPLSPSGSAGGRSTG